MFSKRKEKTRNKEIKVRLTDDEFEAIQNLAKSYDLPTAVFIREQALNGKINFDKKEPPKIEKELLFQLAKIGNNINQIAYRLNAGFKDIDILTELSIIIDKLNDFEKNHQNWRASFKEQSND